MNEQERAFRLVGATWMLTYLAGVMQTPLTFLLKDGLQLNASQISTYQAVAFFPAYVKPLAGILSDSVPFRGTRRRHYLILSTAVSALLMLCLGLVPRRYGVLLSTHFLFTVFEVLISTVLGGLMVDAGLRYRATGRFSAQRVGMTRFTSLLIGPLGLWLAKYPFLWAAALAASLYAALCLVAYLRVQEPPVARVDRSALEESKKQFVRIGRSPTLWRACAMIVLVILSPGFGTPLLFYQTNTLGFSKDFLAVLSFLGGVTGLGAALLYGKVCRRYPLRRLLAASIVVHAVGTLFYLGYRSQSAALWITAVEGLAQTLALLPLYDLAARATPRGCEALGYSVVMSVWNFTGKVSDFVGSWLYDHLHLTFFHLVYLNAGTTALVLLMVPMLPAALADPVDVVSSSENDA